MELIITPTDRGTYVATCPGTPISVEGLTYSLAEVLGREALRDLPPVSDEPAPEPVAEKPAPAPKRGRPRK